MADRNWGMITSGAQFEALATAIVFFEDPAAALFGRRGRDGGQDARSGDGKVVFQAKHHQDRSPAKAIADAKKEARKIIKYRRPDNPRGEQWTGVTHWRLVTNAEFNPTATQAWKDEIAPLFRAMGLEAEVWERANLDALLDKHPEIDRSFFRNETRIFLTLPEVREQLPQSEPFLRRDKLGPFCGRENELRGIREFLESPQHFLVTHGPGGAGKTRLIVEAGEEIAAEGRWQVLWANVASIESSSTWFESIAPERQTLLLVDEPTEPNILRVLSDQLSGRAKTWKVAVAVRSPKDPVLRYLSGPRMKDRVRNLLVSSLPSDAAEKMCFELMSSGPLSVRSVVDRSMLANAIARQFSGHPVWMTLAVHMLELGIDLRSIPEKAEDLAESYLEEITDLQKELPREKVLSLLRWVALIGTVNREDETAIRALLIGTDLGDHFALKAALKSLVDRRALTQRGREGRFVELKPDVLRDHVLLKWLAVDVGFGEHPIHPSSDACELAAKLRLAILEGQVDAVGNSILGSLARTELLLKISGQPVPLLDPIFCGLGDDISKKATASQRAAITEAMLVVAAFRPSDIARISTVLRTSEVDSEVAVGLLGSRTIQHEDVILALPWLVFHAASGAQDASEGRATIAELFALVEAESSIEPKRLNGIPNDGKRAGELLQRAIQGGPQFTMDLAPVAFDLVVNLVDEARETPLLPARRKLLSTAIAPLMSIERRYIWNDDRQFRIQSYLVLPVHPSFEIRVDVRARVKKCIADEAAPISVKTMLWSLLSDAHRITNQSLMNVVAKNNAYLRNEILEDLVWARSVLDGHLADFAELAAARELWAWHLRFEKDQEIKDASIALEEIYTSNEIAREFEPLIARDDWRKTLERAAAKASELAAGGRESIEMFLARAIKYLGREDKLFQLFPVAGELGALARSSAGVIDFVKSSLAKDLTWPHIHFATTVARGWISAIRRLGDHAMAHDVVIELVSVCKNELRQLNVIQQIYGSNIDQLTLRSATTKELDHIRSLGDLFLSHRQGPDFVACVSWSLSHDWGSLRLKIEDVLERMDSEEVPTAIGALLRGVELSLECCASMAGAVDLASWLLNQVNRLSDLDSLGSESEWHLQEILKRIGRAPLSWLPRVLSNRCAQESSADRGTYRALGTSVRFSKFVTAVSAANAASLDNREAVAALIDLVSDQGTTGYYLYEILRDVDPEGFLVPEEVARRVVPKAANELVRRLARISGAYEVGRPPWREIAKPILHRAASTTAEERRSLFSALTDQGIRSWMGARGAVPEEFVVAVASARLDLQSEKDSEFFSFWEWRLQIAEAELKAQEEEAKEERGE